MLRLSLGRPILYVYRMCIYCVYVHVFIFSGIDYCIKYNVVQHSVLCIICVDV